MRPFIASWQFRLGFVATLAALALIVAVAAMIGG